MPTHLRNEARGKVYYGMHFYPGVAEYVNEENGKAFRVFINESTIREMGPSFAGCPIYVEHVDGVSGEIDEVRKEADGWVLESFFNTADGKHWVKFIVVSEAGEDAIASGMRLSNAYHPELTNQGGFWNGVTYQQEVVGGKFEHLAIVDNPRYEESVIMTPEQFKAHNDKQNSELKRLANSKQGEKKMPGVLKFFEKKAVKNDSKGIEIEKLSVTLPKSKRNVTIEALCNEADDSAMPDAMANGDHMINVGDEKMKVNDLVKKYLEKCSTENAVDDAEDMENAEDDEVEATDEMENDADVEEEDLENEGDFAELVEHPAEKKANSKKVVKKSTVANKKAAKKNSLTEDEKQARKERFEVLKNARDNQDNDLESPDNDCSWDGVSLGQQRYGSSN